MSTSQTFVATEEHAGKTVTAALRIWLPGQSWSQVRKLLESNRVLYNGEVWLDEARRVQVGDTLEILAQPKKRPSFIDQIPIRYVDEHVVVVEKPSGISTVRHPEEREWLEARRLLVETLDDLVFKQLGGQLRRFKHEPHHRLRIVHRLDKETSGLVVFARTVDAERGLGMQFRKHTVTRRYLAVVPGRVTSQTIRSYLVRDRGDGKRGSWDNPKVGKEAITHVEVIETFADFTLLSCRLETGRTHQIRIHLSELGHPVCGERVYRLKEKGVDVPDNSGAPRLALHATELGFQHPITTEPMHWEMPLPYDLRSWIEKLKLHG